MCGKFTDTSLTGLQEVPALPEDPVRPESTLHSQELRYSLISDRIDSASQRKAKVFTKYTPAGRLRQATIFGGVGFTNGINQVSARIEHERHRIGLGHPPGAGFLSNCRRTLELRADR